EGVVGRLRARAGEGVEQRGLARVGHADDADLHARAPMAVPSTAPARMSDGQCTPRYRRERAIAQATGYTPGTPRRAYCPAAQKDVEEWALGKLSSRGTPTRGGSPSTRGRGRRTTNLIAVFRPYVPATTPAARSHAARRGRATAAPGTPHSSPRDTRS